SLDSGIAPILTPMTPLSLTPSSLQEAFTTLPMKFSLPSAASAEPAASPSKPVAGHSGILGMFFYLFI
ncbi:hypothetical protein J8805_29015, partial [Klebsiella pneumoniae]